MIELPMIIKCFVNGVFFSSFFLHFVPLLTSLGFQIRSFKISLKHSLYLYVNHSCLNLYVNHSCLNTTL